MTSIRLPDELSDQLARHCERFKVGQSTAIRLLVADGLWRMKMNRYAAMPMVMKAMGVYDEFVVMDKLMNDYLEKARNGHHSGFKQSLEN
jgi:hypothetical protein